MKIGSVELEEGFLYPKVSFEVVDASGRVESFTGTLDTGFTGWIVLPATEIEKLDLSFSHNGVMTLADDNTVQVPIYVGEVFLAFNWHRVLVVQIGTIPLVGTGITSNSRITLDMIANGQITYAPIDA